MTKDLVEATPLKNVTHMAEEISEGGVLVEPLDTETLVSETSKLLRMRIDELYATLGAQLLVFTKPTSAAGIVSYLSAIRNSSEATLLLEGLSAGPSLTEWATGLEFIHETLEREGKRYLTEKREGLRKALCNEEILTLSDEVNRSTIQILMTIIGATLRFPRELDSISATTLAILLKLGLRNFCASNVVPQWSALLLQGAFICYFVIGI
jgi:hypothetical protein